MIALAKDMFGCKTTLDVSRARRQRSLPAILPAIAVPGLLLLFPLDCACGRGSRGGGGRLIRGRLVREGELVREDRAMLLAVEAGAVKEGSGFLPSKRSPSRAIKSCAIKACAIEPCAIKAYAIKAGAVKASSGSCYQGRCGFLKQINGESTSLLLQILYMAVVVGGAVAGACGSGSIGASQAGQVY